MAQSCLTPAEEQIEAEVNTNQYKVVVSDHLSLINRAQGVTEWFDEHEIDASPLLSLSLSPDLRPPERLRETLNQ